MHPIPPDAKGVQFIKGGERVREGVNSGGIRNKDSKGSEIGQERRQHSEGIRSDVEFLQAVTRGKSWRKGTKEIRRDIQRQKGLTNLWNRGR